MADLSSSLKLWLEYDLNSNKKVLSVIENNLGHIPDDVLKLFSHIIAAHHIWNIRITGEERMYGVWERIPVSDMEKVIKNNFDTSIHILENMDLFKEISYVNTIGDAYINTAEDIFFHVLTHNHYHRGQIARILRENQIDPPDTNYIVFRR
ncbi:MAG: damage-inducible protein DinB [Bacteroidetes bacterium]|nr:damage-inducible protein DinB [Bacteroidota bacterium]